MKSNRVFELRCELNFAHQAIFYPVRIKRKRNY